MVQLKIGQIIKHKVLGLGIVCFDKQYVNVYKQPRNYYSVLFFNCNDFKLFNNDIDEYLLQLEKGENKMAKLDLTVEQREYFVNLFANATAEQNAFTNVDYRDDEYEIAHKELIEKVKLTEDVICREDVWVQILLDGNSLIFTENEEGGAGKHELTFSKLLQGIDKYFKSGFGAGCKNFDELEEKGDFYDNEAILQFALFDEVIYG